MSKELLRNPDSPADTISTEKDERPVQPGETQPSGPHREQLEDVFARQHETIKQLLDNLRVKSPAPATSGVFAPPPPAAQGEEDGGPTSPVRPGSRVDSLTATAPGLRISLAPAEEREKRNAIDAVQRVVAEEFNLQPADLRSHATARPATFPCQVAMYLAKRVSRASLREIGRAFGGKHHSTVLHAVNKIDGLSQYDAQLAQRLDQLTQQLRPHSSSGSPPLREFPPTVPRLRPPAASPPLSRTTLYVLAGLVAVWFLILSLPLAQNEGPREEVALAHAQALPWEAHSMERTPEPPALKSESPPRFAVQAGAFGERERAEALARQLSGRYPQVLVAPVKVRGKAVFRVRLPAETRAAAEALRVSLRDEHGLKSWVVKAE